MEKKSQLSAKLKKFYSDTESLREYLKGESRHQMRLQKNQEFNQNEIAEINKKYNMLHYNSKLNDEHTVGAEQKIRELKSRLRNFKRLVKKSKLRSNEALKETSNNMNILPTRKYGVPPEEVEKKSLESEEYKLDYDFKRLKKLTRTQYGILDTTEK